MKTCIDKTCEAVLCEECNDLKPSMCGDRGLQFPKDACDVITFEGVEDVETKQGLCVDLTEGVHAYDGDGAEISYTVEPSEIGCCDVGEHEVTYTAVGKGNKMLPSFCLGKPMLTTADCGLMAKVVTRVITILQSLPPKIIGAVRTVIPVGTTFDPLEGVSGIDDNGKATVVTYEGRYDETTGMVDIASVESDIEQNAKHLYVSLEPIQDLHGYDKPWAGGAGKNKFLTDFASPQTVNGVTLTKNTDGTVTTNGTITSPFDFVIGHIPLKAGSYVLNGCPANGGAGKYRLQVTDYPVVNNLGQDSGSGVSFTLSEDMEVAVRIQQYNSPSNLVYKPMIRLSSVTDATFAPYSNICPISGRTEVVTQRTGKNLAEEFLPYALAVYNDGFVLLSNTAGSSFLFRCIKGQNYRFSTSGTSNRLVWGFYDERPIAGTAITGSWTDKAYNGVATVTAPLTGWGILYAKNSADESLVGNSQIELGTIATSYEPYDGETYHTELGQTVYGGVLDVVTGKMTIEWAMREFDGSRDEAWSFREGANRNRVVLPDVDERTGSYNTDILGNYITATDGADSNPQVWKANINTLGNLLVGIPSSIGNISKWVEYLSQNPLQIAYKLASPQTIRLDKQTIALLQGDNNVWSEDGKVEVVYTKAISGETQFDIEGVYTIYYHTEDECGNETTVKRYLIVGECDTEQAEPVLCKGKMCCATLDCSENYLVVCNGTVCDGRVGCSSSEPTICNGKICSAKLSCTQTEITPIEAEV